MTMSMLKQASSKSWLISKLWLLDLEIVVVKKGCEKFMVTACSSCVKTCFDYYKLIFGAGINVLLYE